MWSCIFALQVDGIVTVSAETIPAKTNTRRDFFSVYQSLTLAFAREHILVFLSSLLPVPDKGRRHCRQVTISQHLGTGGLPVKLCAAIIYAVFSVCSGRALLFRFSTFIRAQGWGLHFSVVSSQSWIPLGLANLGHIHILREPLCAADSSGVYFSWFEIILISLGGNLAC